MKAMNSSLPGVIIVELEVYRDSRGFFLETFHSNKYKEMGITLDFLQDNHSCSRKGILRGLHAQLTYPQGKLVRVLQGEIYDVAVDIRLHSPTFGKWVGVTLSSENFLQCYIPPGFAHGFCVVSDEAQVEYKCTEVYHPGDEVSLRWDDPEIGIAWPIAQPILSEKDLAASRLSDVRDRLPHYDERVA